MQTDAAPRKTGRLSREDQRRLGDILQRVYDDVVHQGVPDRFKDLVGQLDGGKDPSQAATGASGHDREEENPPDRVVGAHGLQSPGSEGSH
jgi:hypothetical protein